MVLITVCLMAVTLSLDALAVSVTNGISCKGFQKRHAILMGIYFGAFQFLMPLIGWLLGSNLLKYIEAFDHWLALILLSFIGGRMVWSAIRATKEPDTCPVEGLTHPKLLVQALATSIDALAVGVTLAFMDINIFLACGIIGAVAFSLSLLGGLLGSRLGPLFRTRAELVGGIVLIALGVKIFLEHAIV